MKRRINLNSVGFAALGRTLIKNNRAQSKRRRRVLVTTLIVTAIIIGGLIYVMNY